jgi:hypothetical protein
MIARFVLIFVCVFVCCGSLCAQSPQPSLTIYNQDFAVVRQEIPLDLKSGENQINVNDITMHLEPDSVILRDPTGRHAVHVLEQNYRADPISEPLLLSLYEGKTIDFEVGTPQGMQIVKGKVIRSGYTPHDYFAMNRYGQQYDQGQMVAAAAQPIIEINGQLRFNLPGTPRLPQSHRRQHPEAAAGVVARDRQSRNISRRVFLRHRRDELAGRLQHRCPREGRPG